MRNDYEPVGGSSYRCGMNQHLQRLLMVLLFCAVVAATVVGSVYLLNISDGPPAGNGKLQFTFDLLFNSSFSPLSLSPTWITDDSYAIIQSVDGSRCLLLFQAGVNDPVVVLNETAVQSGYPNFSLSSYSFSYDSKHLLLPFGSDPVWRYSFNANYMIYNIDDATWTFLTGVVNDDPVISNAVWSPVSLDIAYVVSGNIFVYQVATNATFTVTTDGDGSIIMNGIQNWVYEEEIFGTYNALWWSPDGTLLSYLKSNQSSVPIFSIPMYEGTDVEMMEIPYPKAGDTNPTVEVMLHNVSSGNTQQIPLPADDYVTGVYWTPMGSRLLVRTLNKLQDTETMYATNMDTFATFNFPLQAQFNGWIETQPIYITSETSLLFIANANEYYHIIQLDTIGEAGNMSTTALTSGNWDVRSIIGWNAASNNVYYLSSEVTPIENHLYSVNTVTSEKVHITTQEGYYTALFSTSADYYILSYLGPSVPRYELWSTNTGTNPTLITVLEDNIALQNLLDGYNIPTKNYFQAQGVDNALNGYIMYAAKPDWHEDSNYLGPILMNVYGGPGSQTVTKRWALGYNEYLASFAGITIGSIDNVGTGGRGVQFLQKTYLNLGKFEVDDQIAAANWIKQNMASRIDTSKSAIWGWSYGGFMTLSTLLRENSGFDCGISVAPVADWHYYDSVYTERYMQTPQENPTGYNTTSVITQIAGTSYLNPKLLLIHGTGDDNVHFQNSAELNKILVLQGIQYDTMLYTNKNHAISGDGARPHMYKLMTNWLNSCLLGRTEGQCSQDQRKRDLFSLKDFKL